MITKRKKRKKKKEREKKGVMFRLVTNFIQKILQIDVYQFFLIDMTEFQPIMFVQ